MPDFRKLIVVEFDRVLHADTTPNDPFEPTYMPDPPMSGNIKFLAWLIYEKEFRVAIFSARSRTDEGIAAMQDFLLNHGLARKLVEQIEWPVDLPHDLHVFIHPRAWRFEGVPPTLEELRMFKPWGKA